MGPCVDMWRVLPWSLGWLAQWHPLRPRRMLRWRPQGHPLSSMLTERAVGPVSKATKSNRSRSLIQGAVASWVACPCRFLWPQSPQRVSTIVRVLCGAGECKTQQEGGAAKAGASATAPASLTVCPQRCSREQRAHCSRLSCWTSRCHWQVASWTWCKLLNVAGCYAFGSRQASSAAGSRQASSTPA